jgi:hypothetical protein
VTYFLLRSFVQKFDHYRKPEQELITRAVQAIKDYLETDKAPYGLRIKKLSPKIYEGRVTIHLRIAYFRDKDVVKFFCLGNHDDIKRCLKRIGH